MRFRTDRDRLAKHARQLPAYLGDVSEPASRPPAPLSAAVAYADVVTSRGGELVERTAALPHLRHSLEKRLNSESVTADDQKARGLTHMHGVELFREAHRARGRGGRCPERSCRAEAVLRHEGLFEQVHPCSTTPPFFTRDDSVLNRPRADGFFTPSAPSV